MVIVNLRSSASNLRTRAQQIALAAMPVRQRLLHFCHDRGESRP